MSVRAKSNPERDIKRPAIAVYRAVLDFGGDSGKS